MGIPGLGLGTGLGDRGRSGFPQVYAVTNVVAWYTNQVTLGASATANPEDGGQAVDMLEVAVAGTHGIESPDNMPYVNGGVYRIRLLIKGVNESMITLNNNVDGGKYWLGNFTTAVTSLASGFSNPTTQAIGGGWYVFTVDLTVVVAGATPNFYLGICKPGPNTNFVGAVTDGLIIGSVRIYRIG